MTKKPPHKEPESRLEQITEKVESGAAAVKRWAADPSRLRRDVRDAPWWRTNDPRIGAWHGQVQQAYAAEDWPLVRQLITSMLQVTGRADSPEIRYKLIFSLVNMGERGLAEQQVRKSVARFPDSPLLRRVEAESFMSRGEYDHAMSAWNMFVLKSHESSPAKDRVPALSATGTVFNFSPLAWPNGVEYWLKDGQPSHWPPRLYRAITKTMISLGSPELGKRVAITGVSAHPTDAPLAHDTIDLIARSTRPGGVGSLSAELRDCMVTTPRLNELIAQTESAETVISDLTHIGPPEEDELRVLTAVHHSGTAHAIQANDFWDEHRISQRAVELAIRDRWPEQFAETDLLTESAWEEASLFGSTYAEQLRTRPSVLAQATLHFFKQELVQRIPAQRIAQDIAASHHGAPIFVELPLTRIPFLAGYSAARMQGIYLYTALRELGCNVYLVRFPRKVASEQPRLRLRKEVPPPMSMPTIRFVTQPAGLVPPRRTTRPVSGHPAGILVPAGIRSVSTVLNRIPEPFIVNSGSAIKGLAYDRSQPQEWGFTPSISLHSRKANLLPTVNFPTSHLHSWRRIGTKLQMSSLQPYRHEPVEAHLSSGTCDTSDWHAWVARSLLPYFKDYSKRARNFLEKHNIRRVEIGDYLYAEPSLLAAQVRARGGRVNIWPHSTNPVHVDYHNPANLHTIRAVTKSGAEAWRDRMPRKRVIQSPDLMLNLDPRPVTFTDGQPLSVVVIGGRALMRDLPIMDIEAHHQLYRDFFEGAASLVERDLVRLHFKPRGMTGEHELWLRNTIGSRCPWEPVLDHPSRIQLPNPVYVSLTVGSSALFEGAVRGIPGIIVAGGAARDYLDPSGSVFPRQSLTSALAAIESTAGASGWLAAQQEQLRRLKAEIHRA